MSVSDAPLAPNNLLYATYDAWNRQVEISDAGGTILTNEYDGNHHRIQKVVTGDKTIDYFYNDRWQCVEEHVGANPASASLTRSTTSLTEIICV